MGELNINRYTTCDNLKINFCPESHPVDDDIQELLNEMISEYSINNMPINVDFRKLVSWLKAGDQLTHQIHPYPAKLLPHIIYFFLKAHSNLKHKIVLDPFCGSGTVALEASIQGFLPLVADANPFALLIAKVKTTPYSIKHLIETAENILIKAKKYRTAPSVDIVNPHLWYPPEHKKKLEILLRAINEIEITDEKDFFKICFSSLAKKISYADPAISVPVRLKTKESFSDATNERIQKRLDWIKSLSVIDEFHNIVNSNIERIKQTNEQYPQRVVAKNVGIDARNIFTNSDLTTQMPDNSVPLIITSPPYGSAQKYIRSSSLSLNWLGFVSPKELRSLEEKSIGREHLITEPLCLKAGDLPENYNNLIERIAKTNKSRARITQKYLIEMEQVAQELSRILAPNGRIIFVLGNNQVCGETLRNDEFMTYCFKKYGLRLKLVLIDDIKSRGLMTKRNRTASIISRETVLVFEK
ncbi:putative methyltransferase Cytosine (N4) specific (C1-like) [Acinetobacter baumannii]|uniref:DNA adenine methylase n=2 Tax=Acinetobacter baumannii TaxID=470 RepID=UPI0002BBCB8E|nr:DNA adenine methylase [Acinetobacter baumannii]SSW85287.1 DNA methylase [Klebsiella pneumoniae]EHT1071976.1 DNA adenine methylase [Acinetobacter baumannii]EJB8488538.1 DNA adenine methylase [Acinetobacter baumannii]EKV7757831.1 DNA adenine methylase [Acinetobacter baumannii]EKW7508487.1 DNA adenine methylase [Acinetobacter baumannii]